MMRLLDSLPNILRIPLRYQKFTKKAKKDTHLNARHMFEGTKSGTFYRACMSRERFTFLVNCLRFDDKNMRAERRKTDTFTPIHLKKWCCYFPQCIMHEGADISENGKLKIILSYNETKSGVDTFDQLWRNMACSRKTRRWPMCIFLWNATINLFVIYVYNSHKGNNKSVSLFQYMIDLGKSLAEPWMHQRLNVPNLRRNFRQDIQAFLNIKPFSGLDSPMGKRTLCSFCPSRLRRMTTNFCVQCERAICG
nr:unnamed protein product [Callosobruchus analis]